MFQWAFALEGKKIVLKGDIRKFANALLLQMFIYHFVSFQSQQNKQFYEISFGQSLGDGSCDGEVVWEILCMLEINSRKFLFESYIETQSKYDLVQCQWEWRMFRAKNFIIKKSRKFINKLFNNLSF